jgi:hypothetical protein
VNQSALELEIVQAVALAIYRNEEINTNAMLGSFDSKKALSCGRIHLKRKENLLIFLAITAIISLLEGNAGTGPHAGTACKLACAWRFSCDWLIQFARRRRHTDVRRRSASEPIPVGGRKLMVMPGKCWQGARRPHGEPCNDEQRRQRLSGAPATTFAYRDRFSMLELPPIDAERNMPPFRV